jgi:AcrR family transcriptional regulator
MSADDTRARILRTAFLEFYRNGFQAGSVNSIVQDAGITKGALFHHWPEKKSLGYAVVDEIIGPLLVQRWLEPLSQTDDPIAAAKHSFRKYVKTDIASGHFVLGCPLNNLAQEMSPLDVGFRSRIDALYDTWRATIAAAFARGKRAGTVAGSVSPSGTAALLVASQMGIYGSGKSSQDKAVMLRATAGVCDYLDSLRPQ